MSTWTKEDIQYIIDNEKIFNLKEFSDKLKRTEKAVRLKLNRLGLSVKVINTEDKQCLQCNKLFSDYISTNRKFCSKSCSAIFTNPNRKRNKIIKNLNKCKDCSNLTKNKLFCSHSCFINNKRLTAYNEFLNNDKVYSENYSPKTFKYIFLKEQNNECAICKMGPIWNDKNIVFILDHIDGNSNNNKRENLRLVCPNCDSQLDTYKSKNKNSGRHYRRERYKEGKSF